MNNGKKRWFCMLLCLEILLFSAVGVWAREPQETEQAAIPDVSISTADDFLRFAQQCRLDAFSEGVLVHLTDDIDLTGVEVIPVPTFRGIFDGKGHTIRGLQIVGEGSVQGLFRYVAENAVVRNLTLQGEVSPSGSRSMVGGIAGSNAGKIEACHVFLTLSGSEQVGGIAGINTVSGVIEECHVEGDIHGNHSVGGVAGENYGVIRDCINESDVNVTAQQNRVDISEVTLDTLLGAETVGAVTDIGGIAGSSSGVIRACTNRGTVGYKHMGYNIGGIAGSQKGYIHTCENYGLISGRKEVGGIVGQIEPTAKIEYKRDALQVLQAQMGSLSALTNRISMQAQGGEESVKNQFSDMEQEVKLAGEALGQLLPENREELKLPDQDTLQAAQNVLSGSIHTLSRNMETIVNETQSTANAMVGDMKAMIDQIRAIGSTIGNASAHLGGSFTDVSDLDTESDTTGKVAACVNYGAVLADRNAGGIAGAASLENDLDPEGDIQVIGNSSLNFSGELRAVILNCENKAEVTAKKRNVGGIAGWMTLGLIKDCHNTGAIQAEGAKYVGGIAGQSNGYIRACNVKCELFGDTCVGGIAGSGIVVSDCRSMVALRAGTEKLGAILGVFQQNDTEMDDAVQNNVYLAPYEDLGGIDGISYATCAQPLEREAFLALDGLHEAFRTVTVRFVFEDGKEEAVTVPLGNSLEKTQIPAIPERDGVEGIWDGLEEFEASEPVFDMVFYAVYASPYTTIQSEMVRKNGRPVLLGQGEFPSEQWITLTECTEQPALQSEQTFVEGWEITLPSVGTIEVLRYALPGEYKERSLQLMAYDASGSWRELEFTMDGSHLVFALEKDDTAFCLLQTQPNYVFLLLISCAIIILLQFLLLLTMRIKLRKQNMGAAAD